MSQRRLAISCLSSLLGLLGAAGGTAAQTRAWPVYQNDRYGFTISYPGEIFKAAGPGRPDGQLFVSVDGKAKLLVSASVNSTNETVESYRAFVLRTAYPEARLSYGRRDNRLFIVSGFKGDQIFYERVEFGCRGRIISGWQILYPAAERATYDSVVERMSRSWKPVSERRCQ
ncbi:MAG TPA: hypothetical protein PK264_03050 [Hyphomicrobiaceae bacterium]|nr:hypothetical protein [Hyphomicrobiaceae bacterium]